MEKYQYLRRHVKGVHVEKWTIDNIRDGLEYFKELNGRYPGSREVDSFEYLPTRKMIERNFGGLEKLKSSLGYVDTNFGKGKFRSEIAFKVNKRGRDTEIQLQKLLVNKFGEVFVHTEKIFDNTKNRVDFYIYAPKGNFGVDVFCTETMHNLQGNINVKLNKYSDFKEKMYFVVAGGCISQEDLDNYLLSKIRHLPANSEIVTFEKFAKSIRYMAAFTSSFNDSNTGETS